MAVKSALQLEVVKFKISYTGLKCFIKFYTHIIFDKYSGTSVIEINFIVFKTKNYPYNLVLKVKTKLLF